MAKIYGALEVAQLEWFTDAGKPAPASYIYRVIYVSDLKQVQVSDGTNWIAFLNTSTNQTLSGNITFTGAQIFTGSHRLSVTTDAASSGAVIALAATTPVIEFTGAITSIAGIASGVSGATVMLVNRTGGTFAVLDDDATAGASDRIRTGTGSQITLANNASILLTYVGDSRWHVIGGSGSGTGGGALNYITNGSAEADTLGWATYADAAGTSPVDGTGGVANVTFTRSTTSPLVGTASFIFTKDAVNRQGQGASYAFTIDAGFKAKVLQISFQYLVDSGTFVAGSSTTDSDVTVWLYDVTNNLVIQPSSYKLLSNNGSIADTFNGTFQTASNSTSYRLIFHVGSTSAAAYSLKIDNIYVSPSTYVYGTPITDWAAYTPTTAGLGTISAVNMFWRRVGSNVEVMGTLTTGTVTAVEAQIGLPAGLTSTSTISTIQQAGTVVLGTSTSSYRNLLIETSKTYLTVGVAAASSQLAKALGTTFANTIVISFQASVPVQGWSSSVQTSDQTDTRVVAFAANKTAIQSIANNSSTVIDFNSVEINTHGSTYAAGAYTVPVAGYYRVAFNFNFASGSGGTIFAQLNKNGAGYARLSTQPFATAQSGGTGATVLYLNSGENVSLSVIQISGAAQNLEAVGRFSVERLSGPSAIAASETVAASYWAGASGTSTSTTPINFSSKEYDTHNAVTTGASWRFTAPISGIYAVNVWVNITGAVNTFLYIYKNSTTTDYKTIAYTNTAIAQAMGASALRLNAGDYIAIHTNASVGYDGNASLASEPTNINIVRVGN